MKRMAVKQAQCEERLPAKRFNAWVTRKRKSITVNGSSQYRSHQSCHVCFRVVERREELRIKYGQHGPRGPPIALFGHHLMVPTCVANRIRGTGTGLIHAWGEGK